MKKWMIIPAVLLVLSGFLFSSCPSQPDTSLPPRINADITFNLAGEYEFEFDNIKIEDGKTYEVLIIVKEVDYELGGCHFQGQLFYDQGGVRYLLAGSQNALPTVIADFGKRYRITLTAGDYGTGKDDESDPAKQAKGGYKMPPSGKASTPDGAERQYLRLTIRTPNWYVMGLPWDQQEVDPSNEKDDWDVDYYAGEAEGAGIVGEISVRIKPNFTFIPGERVLVTNPEDTMTGNIEDDEFQKLKDAPENSVLRVYCTAKIGSGSAGGTQAEPGWAIAEFGVTKEYKVRGQNISTPVLIPRTWEGKPVPTTPNPAFTFYADILISDILADAEETLVFLNVYNGAKVTDLVICTPSLVELPPEITAMLEWYNKLNGKYSAEELLELLKKIDDYMKANQKP